MMSRAQKDLLAQTGPGTLGGKFLRNYCRVRRDATKEHLGSSDIVIAAVRRALRKAIAQVRAGKEAPGLIRGHSKNPLAEFVCTSGYVEDHENGTSFCRCVLGAQTAAE